METIDYLKELALNRTKLLHMDAEVYDAQKELEQSEPYLQLQERKEALKVLRARVDGLAGGIKDRVETEFNLSADKNTKPYDGIQIKKFQVVTIIDERKAKAWAGNNAPGTLSIKKAQFNKVAKALDSLEFVKIEDEYRVQIASNLSMYEGDENVD